MRGGEATPTSRRVTSQSPTARRTRRRSFAKRPAWAASLLALTGCTPAGLLTGFDRLTAPGGVTRVAEGAAYGSEPRQKLDVWAPARGAGAGEALPVVVFFYGGGWHSGNRGDYGFAGAAFAAEGFVAIVPDYRLVPGVRFPAFVEDGALAVRWARDNAARYGGDPNRITLAGHSAGAYNAAMLALDRRFLTEAGVDPKTVRAAALLSGPYDFYPFTEPAGRGAFGAHAQPLETQPIQFARADAPPIFLGHGSEDRLVYPHNSRHLAQRLQQAGAPVTLRIYQGASHVDLAAGLSRTFRQRVPVLAESSAFLHQHSR